MISITIDGGRAKATTNESGFPTDFIRQVSVLGGRKSWASMRSVSFDASGVNLKILKAKKDIQWIDKTGKLDMIERLGTLAKQDDMVKRVKSKWKPALQPMKHQQQCLDVSWDREAYALLFEMSLGKTYVVIANIGMLHAAGKVNGALIITPKGVDSQWVDEEIPKHIDKKFKVNAVKWNGKGFDANKFKRNHLNFYVMNIDALRGKGGPAALKFAEMFDGESFMAIDESHKIKNGSSQRSKFARALGSHFTYRRIMTGTPIGKSVIDAWSQFMFLNEDILGHRYMTSFRSRYCVMGGWQGKQIVGQQNLEEFNRLIAPHSFRIKKDEVLDLPPKLFEVREYDMNPKAKRHYNELKTILMTDLSDGTRMTAANAAAKIVRLQQIVCGVLPSEKGGFVVLGNERIDEMMAIVEQRTGQIIIWSRFREDIKRICERLKKEKETFVEYRGGMSSKERDAAKRSFLAGKARIVVANQDAGGTGLNLQGDTDTVIYYSNTFDALQRWQSEDRAHRPGMRKQITYYDLVAKGTVDRLFISNLKGKKGLADLTLDEIRKALR